MPTITTYATAGGKRYLVRYRTPDRRQTMKRGFATKRDAERFLAGVEMSKDRGEWVDPTKSRVTIADWAEQWYEAQVQLKPTTRSGYRHGLDKHVLPRWGKTRLGEVSHADVQAWVSDLSARLAPSTVRQIHLVLSGVLKYAVMDKRIPANPSDGVRLPRIVKTSRGYLSNDQVARLARACGPDADVIILLAYTGLRWGEMAGLKTARIDLDRRRIDVADAVSDPRGRVIWGTPKSHERRSVPFPDFLSESLRARCTGKHPDDLVFMAPDGGVLRSGNFRNRRFNSALASIQAADPEFPKVTPHDLRHTAASLAVSVGANVKAVQRMLGHSSAAMTLDVYADLFDDDLDAVAVALNGSVPFSNVFKMCSLNENEADVEPEIGHKKRPLPSVS